eukprot:CFRG0552T1
MDLLSVALISRHGSRTRLDKENRHEEEGEAQLTAAGREELLYAGQYIRETYITENAPTPITGISAIYDLSQVSAISSDTDRTLESAAYFLRGMYNSTQVFVPVHSTSVDTDMVLRGHLQCPKYQRQLDDFYASDAYMQKASETAALRAIAYSYAKAVFSDDEELTDSLADVYNVYDVLTHTNTTIPTSTLSDMEELAFWLEFSKFSGDGGIVSGAGRIMHQIYTQFNDVIEMVNADGNEHMKVKYYSGHYPVMLPLLSNLHMGSESLRKIPHPGSILAFELYRNGTVESDGTSMGTTAYEIRVVLRAPTSEITSTATNTIEDAVVGQNAEVLPIFECGNSEYCEWTKFESILNEKSLKTDVEWCDYCAAPSSGGYEMSPRCTMVGSDSASQTSLTTLTQSTNNNTTSTESSWGADNTVWVIVLAVVLTAAFGLVLTWLCCRRRRLNRQKRIHQNMYGIPGHHEGDSGSSHHKHSKLRSAAMGDANVCSVNEESKTDIGQHSQTSDHTNPLYVSGEVKDQSGFAATEPASFEASQHQHMNNIGHSEQHCGNTV